MAECLRYLFTAQLLCLLDKEDKMYDVWAPNPTHQGYWTSFPMKKVAASALFALFNGAQFQLPVIVPRSS